MNTDLSVSPSIAVICGAMRIGTPDADGGFIRLVFDHVAMRYHVVDDAVAYPFPQAGKLPQPAVDIVGRGGRGQHGNVFPDGLGFVHSFLEYGAVCVK
jgi:hypothetical protein